MSIFLFFIEVLLVFIGIYYYIKTIKELKSSMRESSQNHLIYTNKLSCLEEKMQDLILDQEKRFSIIDGTKRTII